MEEYEKFDYFFFLGFVNVSVQYYVTLRVVCHSIHQQQKYYNLSLQKIRSNRRLNP